jgi:hypothetical protein
MTDDVYLVLVEFGREREQAALHLLTTTLHRLFPTARVRLLIVDNAADNQYEAEIGPDLYHVGGDNSLHEFSGWDRGIAWLHTRWAPANDSIVVLANDTVARADKLERIRDVPADRAAAARQGALVGWIDEFPRTFELFGFSLRQWIDTSLVIAERQTLAALSPFARPLSDTQLFADDWRRVFREPSPLSENYRGYLKAYFFGEPTAGGFEHSWYAQEPLSEENFDAFKMKLRCVFCEHLLSARARARGIALVDIRLQPLAIDRADVVAS